MPAIIMSGKNDTPGIEKYICKGMGLKRWWWDVWWDQNTDWRRTELVTENGANDREWSWRRRLEVE